MRSITKIQKRQKQQAERIDNLDQGTSRLLTKDQPFQKIFNPLTGNGVEKPRMDGGTKTCNCWSAMRFCDKSYTRSHTGKNHMEKYRWVRFLRTLIVRA